MKSAAERLPSRAMSSASLLVVFSLSHLHAAAGEYTSGRRS
ncbi:hypothetical protein SeW_A5063 [Salmonella enterica subsp. enterica serovar Weltevreden str. HI_N05-537]|nr:hypothetical protein SeW_A5063 [Salmonella enterica subsp. enterica serovar Weltevreden str. HI_N05-537]